MGRAKSAEIFSFEAKKCVCSLFFPENSCCQDEHEFFKVDDKQVFSPGITPDFPDFYFIAETFSSQFSSNKTVEAIIYNCFNEYSPPIPLYKVNCSFVFYDGDPYVTA